MDVHDTSSNVSFQLGKCLQAFSTNKANEEQYTNFFQNPSLDSSSLQQDSVSDDDDSTVPYLSSSSEENSLDSGNMEVACNSSNQNPHNGIVQQQNSNISHSSGSANNFTDFQEGALLLFTECGFTEEKAKKVVEAIGEKPKSIQWYKCFWRRWYKWCQENSVHHLDCSSFQFLRFLQQFALGRKPVTVKDCCDAIGRVVMHAGMSDLAFKAPVVKDYIKRINSEPKPDI